MASMTRPLLNIGGWSLCTGSTFKADCKAKPRMRSSVREGVMDMQELPDTSPDITLTGGMPRVVIVGAGFGGLKAAHSLRHLPVQVTVVDRHNHHLFQPLLYQVATAGISPADICS